RSRRPARRRRAALRRLHPGDQTRLPGHGRRSADARLLGTPRRRRDGRRLGARRVRAEPRDRSPAHAPRPRPAGGLRPDARRARARETLQARGTDEDELDARPRRDRARDRRDARRPSRDPRRHRHVRAVPAADAESPAGRALRHAGGVRALPSARSRARLPRGRLRPARALELPRRPRVRAQQRRLSGRVSEFLSDYGLFLAELATIIAVLLVIVAAIAAAARRGGDREGLEVQHLNRRFEESANVLKRVMHGKQRFRKEAKERRKEKKREERARAKGEPMRPRLFVLDFKGDIRATATASLREEVSAVLAAAADGDEVLVRLENSGGTVHEHGLAASQLLRIKQRKLELVVAVDKVAASGGYLMACVADRILAAPFAIVGSIGVLAQLPNFHRALEERGIDFEQIAAGRYKRTLTLFGKNTDEGRDKLKQELEDVHELFKKQIRDHRPQVDVEAVATGEHWYGVRALELKLVDDIRTSDDFLTEAAKEHDLYHVVYRRKRSWPERMMSGADALLSR